MTYTPGRLIQALRNGDIDVFDALELVPEVMADRRAVWQFFRYARAMGWGREQSKLMNTEAEGGGDE